MAHDVFISYSMRDTEVANTVLMALERRGVRCWIASRDVVPGVSWLNAITQAIEASRAFLFILSSESISSPQLMREIVAAHESGVPIIPFRIEDVRPPGDWKFFMGDVASVDATKPPLEQHIERLYSGLQSLLGVESPPPAGERETAPARDVSYPRESPSLPRRLSELFKAVIPARHTPRPAATTPPLPGTTEEPAQPKSKGYVFLSYANEDLDSVQKLREVLKAKGYAYWDYTAGDRDYHGALYRELQERILGAEAFVAIVSDSWQQSDWPAQEFTYARDAHKPIFVLQVKTMARPFPILLNLQTRIDMSGHSEHGKQTLLEELAKKGL